MIGVVSAVLAAVFLSVSLTAGPGSRLAGTRPLRMKGDLSLQLVEAMDRFLLRQIAESPQARGRFWSWDYSSPRAYLESIESNRDRFQRRIGAVDDRLPAGELELVATFTSPSLVAENGRLRVFAVRWPVLDGVDAEGLLLEPAGKARAQVVVIPDADWTPEMLAGLHPQTPPRLQAARILAEAGCRVLVPALIDRKNTWSGNRRVRMSNQTHREFIYRQAYFMGRHPIGYEVQKVLAALDYFSRNRSGPAGPDTPLGIAGHGEGGLVALYSAALDSRVRATLVSGYFQPREHVWQEPVYRNVWGLLEEFGDAEIASLIAPRALLVEACRGPEVPGPPPPREGRMDAASGKLETPPLDRVRAEFRRARRHFERLRIPDRIKLIVSGSGAGPPVLRPGAGSAAVGSG